MHAWVIWKSNGFASEALKTSWKDSPLGFSSCQVTAKATVLFATTASFGMLLMSMQNMGLVGMMTVDWPVTLDGIFSICKFFLLDIDSYGFSCIAGRGFHEVYTLDDDRWVGNSGVF